MSPSTIERRTIRRRIAKFATEVLAPWVWVGALPVAIAWHATRSVPATMLWGLLIAITGSAIPMAVIVHGARLGHWASHHVTNREGRRVPLLACVTSLGAPVGLLPRKVLLNSHGHDPQQVLSLQFRVRSP